MSVTRRLLLGTALLARPGLAPPALAQADPALARVMAGLAAVRERRSTFTEQKAIPEIDLPLPSEGTLRWRAPDELEKHTTWPIDERLVVARGRLAYARPDRGISRDFALDEQPEMQALVEAIRGTLAGDLAALERFYRLGFTAGAGGAWTLALTPLSLRVRAAVQLITVTGTGAEITGVDTEGGGGITRMRIAPAP